MGVVGVFPEPEGSLLPSAQNNVHAKVAHLWEACSEPFICFELNKENKLLIPPFEEINILVKKSKAKMI